MSTIPKLSTTYPVNTIPTAFQELINKVGHNLNFCVKVEEGTTLSDVVNYDKVRCTIL